MLRQKLSTTTISTLTLITSALAHNESGQAYGLGMMNGGGWMHNGWHMLGYNMWGMGWFGLLFGLAFWTLVILAIIYLFQKITE